MAKKREEAKPAFTYPDVQQGANPDDVRRRLHDGFSKALTHTLILPPEALRMITAQQKYWDASSDEEVNKLVGFLPTVF